MIETKYFMIKTEYGIIYTMRDYKVENNYSFPYGIMKEVFTELKCEIYFNYIEFYDGLKNLRYAELNKEDDNLKATGDNVKEVSKEYIEKLLQESRNKGINLKEETLNVIDKGVSRKMANKEVKAFCMDNNLLTEIFEDSDEELETFNLVFGDLFEDDVLKR